jgi:D-glycero-D-manno-heptose 1,7-bisphosphate phosphatase
MRRRALFLDRDGVINVDHAYVFRKEDFQFNEGIFELCWEAKSRGYSIVVVTNQAGIARGYYSEDDFQKLTDWMTGVFDAKRCQIDAVYFCPYHPEHGVGVYKRDSNLRKPKPGMILRAAIDLNIDLGESLLIGDKLTDIQAGLTAGIKKNLLFIPSHDLQYDSSAPVPADIIKSLREAIQYL